MEHQDKQEEAGTGGAMSYNSRATGAGASGTSFSGGTGGGSGDSGSGYAGQANGGAGGARNGGGTIGQGVGNPSGGTGGLLIIYANNNINNGSYLSTGSKAVSVESFPGGSSGGGTINIFYKEQNVLGTVNANGGAATVQSGYGGRTGGAGGNGCVSAGSIKSGTYISD